MPLDGEDALLWFKCDLLILEDREELTDRDTSGLIASERLVLEGRLVLEICGLFDSTFDRAVVSDFEESSDTVDTLDFVESSDMMETFV